MTKTLRSTLQWLTLAIPNLYANISFDITSNKLPMPSKANSINTYYLSSAREKIDINLTNEVSIVYTLNMG